MERGSSRKRIRGRLPYDKRQVWKICLALTKAVRKSRRRKGKGRPAVYDSRRYIAIILFQFYYTLTYRQLEGDLRLFLRKVPNFRTINWYSIKRLTKEDIHTLLRIINKKMARSIKSSEKICMIDSSGFSHRAKSQILRRKRGEEEIRATSHSRLCIIACYIRRLKRLFILSASSGKAYESDSKLAMEGLRHLAPVSKNKKVYLLEDKGFDSERVLEAERRKGFIPIMPLKEQGEVRSKIRKETKRNFRKRLYRYRGVVESIFGSLKTKTAGRLNFKNPAKAEIIVLVLACVYNLSVLLKLLFIIIRFIVD